MVRENIRPTRLELIRTRRRIVVAQRGLKLLKLKRSALIIEFFKMAGETLEQRGNLKRKLAAGFESIRRAERLEGSARLENISMMLPNIAAFRVVSHNVMGVKTPTIDGPPFSPYDPATLVDLPTSVNEALLQFQEAYQLVLVVAEKENGLRRLLKEIEKTKRRANAIENVLIPRLVETARYIKFRFDEMERDSFSMLKQVKRKIDSQEESEHRPEPATEVSA
jgi:V/A-type H+-transporting ATPase subunit D